MRTFIRSVGKLLLQILSIAVVVGALYLLFLLIRQAFLIIVGLEKTVVAAFVASITAVFGYWYTQRQTTSRTIAEAHRKEKAKLYHEFMDLLGRFFKPGMREKGEMDPDDLPGDILDAFFAFNSNLIVWGSPEMIHAYLNFRNGASDPEKQQYSLLFMDDMLTAIRRDLGNSNRRLKRGDLIKTFLTDPEELDKLL
jgi:hypothetical protein